MSPAWCLQGTLYIIIYWQDQDFFSLIKKFYISVIILEYIFYTKKQNIIPISHYPMQSLIGFLLFKKVVTAALKYSKSDGKHSNMAQM